MPLVAPEVVMLAVLLVLFELTVGAAFVVVLLPFSATRYRHPGEARKNLL